MKNDLSKFFEKINNKILSTNNINKIDDCYYLECVFNKTNNDDKEKVISYLKKKLSKVDNDIVFMIDSSSIIFYSIDKKIPLSLQTMNNVYNLSESHVSLITGTKNLLDIIPYNHTEVCIHLLDLMSQTIKYSLGNSQIMKLCHCFCQIIYLIDIEKHSDLIKNVNSLIIEDFLFHEFYKEKSKPKVYSSMMKIFPHISEKISITKERESELLPFLL